MSKFVLYQRSNPCPICDSSDGRCKTSDDSLIFCMSALDAVDIPGFRFLKLTRNGVWGIWAPDDGDWSDGQRETWRLQQQALRRKREQAERERRSHCMPVAERDLHYRRLLAELTLHPDDRADLHERGITDKQIAAWGVVSVAAGQRLSGCYPSNLPGIGRDGRSLAVGSAGYLCPIRNSTGQIQGFQLRVRGASEGKYRWVSSQHNSVALPNDELPIAVFGQLNEQNRAYLVEGVGAKPLIASQRLNCRTVGSAGGQFAGSPEQLQAIVGDQSPVLLPDGGAVKNPQIMRQYRSLQALLPHNLRVLWWGQVDKGFDVDEVSPQSLDQARLIGWNEFEAIAATFNKLSETQSDSWQQRYEQQAKAAWLRSRRYTPTNEATQQFVRVELAKLLQVDIHALKSDMGTGKTQELARLARLLAELEEMGAIAVGYRNSLLLQSCERWGGFYHLHADSAFGLIADRHSRIAACIDSLLHFRDEDFDGRVLILDEVVSVLKHGLFSSTLKGKRDLVLAKLQQAVRRAAVVIAWDGNCCDVAINYLVSLRGENARVVKQLNRFKGDRLQVELVRSISSQSGKLRLQDVSPVVNKLDEALEAAKFLPPETARAIGVIADSQRLCETLDDRYSQRGFNVLRVDGKTVLDADIKQFLKNPDAGIEQRKPDLLILSPTAESGLDISIKRHFCKGFAFFFGVIDTATQMQFLRRVRDCLNWSVWCQEYTVTEEFEGSRSPFARRLAKQFLEYLEMDALAALDGTDRAELAQSWWDDFQQNCNNVHFQTAMQLQAARNYERAHTRECLQIALEAEGHSVALVDLEHHPQTSEQLSEQRKAIIRADSTRIFSADDISLTEAIAIKSSFSASIEQRFAADKALLNGRLPGIENTPIWSAELIEKVLFRDRGLLMRLERYWMLRHMDAAKVRAVQLWTGLADADGQSPVKDHRASLTDIRSDYTLLRALNSLGISELFDSGALYKADDPVIQGIYNRCKRSKRLQIALRRTVGKSTPLEFVGRLVALIGGHSESEFIQQQGDRVRAYRYCAPEQDMESRAILNCFDRRFEKYLFSETAATQTSLDVEPDHLPLKKVYTDGQGDQTLVMTATGFEAIAENDPWMSPESLADVRSWLDAAADDVGMRDEIRRLIPDRVWESVTA